MQKTKLGISVGLFGAAVYFMGLFGGYLVMILLAGYALLFEQNEWLRKSVVKAVVLAVCFSLLTALINLIPDAISFIGDIASAFNASVYLPRVRSIIEAITDALAIIEKVLLIVLGVKALNQSTITIPVVDKLINKYMG